ncbi:MAG: homoserine lactone transporter [Fibrobacteres bacterium CG2_30_45_31]|nr:MAG: homoserine lactone transporter [Fibrobacteres bacterium CG2_30_45_31]
MYGIENYFGFIIAGLFLNIVPGVDTVYILTRSMTQGRRAGFYSVFGIITGALIHTTLAALGLSIILAKSIIAFNIIKTIGIAYLVYLGIKMLIEKNNLFDNNAQQIGKPDLLKIYRQGLLTDLLNPKVALFFLSLLPQFINPHYTNGPIPFLILGLTFTTTGTIWCLFLAHSASYVTKTLRNNEKIGKWMQKISGIVFIGLGISLY